MSSELGAVSPPNVITGSSRVTVVLFTVVVVPLTVKLPVKLELTPTFNFPEIVVSSPVPLPKKLLDLVFN